MGSGGARLGGGRLGRHRDRAHIVIGLILRGLYGLVAGAPTEAGEAATGTLIMSLLTGFLAYLVGGYVAGRRAGSSGGLNGAMTAVLGIVVGMVLAIVWVIATLIFTGGDALSATPMGFGAIVAGTFLAGVLLLMVDLLGGYLGGKLGEPGRGRPSRGKGNVRT